MDVRRGDKFIKIEQPPASFLTTMEEYIREAPRASTVQKDQARDGSGPTQVILATKYKKDPEQEEATPPQPPPPLEPVKIEVSVPEKPEKTDLLVLSDPAPKAFDLDNKNAMALAIVPIDNVSSSATTRSLNPDNGVTGWELALVTAPSSNETTVTSSKLVRHPNILSFLHSTEAEVSDASTMKHTIYIVIEPVMPLSEKIKELNLSGTQKFMATCAWPVLW